MAEMSVRIEGVDRLIGNLEAAPGIIDTANNEAMQKSVLLLEASVKARTPRRTGRLFASINGRVVSVGELSGRVGTNVSYARFVERGRGPVVAKRGRALRFRGSDGRTIFRRAVGPALGRFMFREGLAASAESIKGYFRESARKVTEFIAKGA